MSRDRWQVIEEEGGALIMARRWPLRFDLAVSTQLPDGGRRWIAHQVRQDVWRALRGLRGFVPAVRVLRRAGGLCVTAGGEVAGRFDRGHAEACITDVLEDRSNRTRWLRARR